MATRISGTVKGPPGLDDPHRMLGEPRRATTVSWRSLRLTAVIAKGTEVPLKYPVEAVKRLTARRREEHLDAPETALSTESLPDTDESDV